MAQFFLALFISSTGLVLSPVFLMHHLPVLAAGALLVIVGKTLLVGGWVGGWVGGRVGGAPLPTCHAVAAEGGAGGRGRHVLVGRAGGLGDGSEARALRLPAAPACLTPPSLGAAPPPTPHSPIPPHPTPVLLLLLQITAVVSAFKYPLSTALAVGLNLSQIGEFVFVLLSVANQQGLLASNVYLLLMGEEWRGWRGRRG